MHVTQLHRTKKGMRREKKINTGILLKDKQPFVKHDELLSAWSVWRSLHACCDRLFMSTLCAEKKKKYACHKVIRSRNTTVEHFTR